MRFPVAGQAVSISPEWRLRRTGIFTIWVDQAFDNKKYAFAADYIRLWAVYNYGGFYLDMELCKNLDTLLDREIAMAYENKEKEGIEAGCFGASKGNPFIYDCLSYYNDRRFVNEDGSLETYTLPMIMHSAYKKKYTFELFGEDYFTAKSFEDGVVRKTSNTYSIHHFAGSWLSDEEKAMQNSVRTLSKFLGARIGRNVVEYSNEIRKKGFGGALQLTKKKIFKRIQK